MDDSIFGLTIKQIFEMDKDFDVSLFGEERSIKVCDDGMLLYESSQKNAKSSAWHMNGSIFSNTTN